MLPLADVTFFLMLFWGKNRLTADALTAAHSNCISKPHIFCAHSGSSATFFAIQWPLLPLQTC